MTAASAVRRVRFCLDFTGFFAIFVASKSGGGAGQPQRQPPSPFSQIKDLIRMDYRNGKPLGGSADTLTRNCGKGYPDGAVNIGMTFEQLKSTWMSKPRRYALRDE